MQGRVQGAQGPREEAADENARNPGGDHGELLHDEQRDDRVPLAHDACHDGVAVDVERVEDEADERHQGDHDNLADEVDVQGQAAFADRGQAQGSVDQVLRTGVRSAPQNEGTEKYIDERMPLKGVHRRVEKFNPISFLCSFPT